jgi:murein tripeptide amidase MpaA
VAEATDYKATSRHADVLAFVRELQKQSPLLRVERLCVSAEGRDVPLLVVGSPVPASPLAARQDGKVVVYIQANIHAGEVEGKESTLMVVRDILQQAKPPYLDKLVLLIAPIFNADGNDRIDPNNRRQQPGPEQGVGVRSNGQNLDLNRDAIKAESPEVQGLLRVLSAWDPILLVDCHTTDGAYHEQTVTYSWPVNPNGDAALIEFQRSKMLPAIEKQMKDKYRTLGLGYGGYRDSRAPEKGWETLEPQPRYITNYIGLRNRLGILVENYVHADFRTRVQGNTAILYATLDYVHAHAEEIRKMIAEADARTVARGLAPKPADAFGLEFEVKALAQPVTVLGFEMESVQREGAPYPQMRPTDKKKPVTIPYFADFVAKRSVPLPAAYLLPAAPPEVVEKLLLHGLLVERLAQPVKLEVQSFKLKEIKGAAQIYQGHRTNTVKGDYLTETRDFPAGTVLVTMAQPLANVAAYLLEPESDDGLLAWNFFDKAVVGQWSRELAAVPVFRLMKPTALAKDTMR